MPEQDLMGDGKNMDSPDSSKRIGRGLCESTKDEGYIDRSSCLTGLSLKLNMCNRILQVFLFVQAFKQCRPLNSSWLQDHSL